MASKVGEETYVKGAVGVSMGLIKKGYNLEVRVGKKYKKKKKKPAGGRKRDRDLGGRGRKKILLGARSLPDTSRMSTVTGCTRKETIIEKKTLIHEARRTGGRRVGGWKPKLKPASDQILVKKRGHLQS